MFMNHEAIEIKQKKVYLICLQGSKLSSKNIVDDLQLCNSQNRH